MAAELPDSTGTGALLASGGACAAAAVLTRPLG
jgi:hypothetical protein